MYRCTFILIFIVISLSAFSQGELNDEVLVVTGNEKSYAVLINSNGWGFNLRRGKRLDGFRKRILDFDLAYIKHPKEIKTQNPYSDNQKRFVFGKLNTLVTLRAGIGIQKEIYSKFDKGGIAIKYFYEGGLSLAILKPQYYQVVDSEKVSGNRQIIYTSDKLFDYNIHQVSDIYSRSAFVVGLNETKIKPGLFVKFGLSFVYSNLNEAINALEAGVILDFYASNLPIMATKKNEPYIISLFVSYRFGRVGVKNKKGISLDNASEEL